MHEQPRPRCERIVGLQQEAGVWLSFRTYVSFAGKSATSEEVLSEYISSPAYRDDMVGPGFQIAPERDVHGPFRASHLSLSNYSPISYDQLRYEIEKRIEEQFFDNQEENNIADSERAKLEKSLSKVQESDIYKLALEHKVGNDSDNKHDWSAVLWEYKEYVSIPPSNNPCYPFYLLVIGFD